MDTNPLMMVAHGNMCMIIVQYKESSICHGPTTKATTTALDNQADDPT